MIDSYAHVSFGQFDQDRETVISRAKNEGVTGWIEVGTDLAQSRKAIDLAQEYENAWASVGVHPTDVPKEGLMDFQDSGREFRITPSPPAGGLPLGEGEKRIS